MKCLCRKAEDAKHARWCPKYLHRLLLWRFSQRGLDPSMDWFEFGGVRIPYFLVRNLKNGVRLEVINYPESKALMVKVHACKPKDCLHEKLSVKAFTHGGFITVKVECVCGWGFTKETLDQLV